eukprot:8123211-Pyramimonas_sp.AAC.1
MASAEAAQEVPVPRAAGVGHFPRRAQAHFRVGQGSARTSVHRCPVGGVHREAVHQRARIHRGFPAHRVDVPEHFSPARIWRGCQCWCTFNAR